MSLQEFLDYLSLVEDDFKEIFKKIPEREDEYLPPYWLHIEMIERYMIIKDFQIKSGFNLIEICSGPHAISTIPLAYYVGDSGRVIAVERGRWGSFREIVELSGLSKRIIPLNCDARNLPIKYKYFDMAVLIHGIRSVESEDNLIKILKEMKRVANRIVIAETLPIAKTYAQKAHLEMYNVRVDVLKILTGKFLDMRYMSMDRLIEICRNVGIQIISKRVIEVDLPHYLSFIPKSYVEKIKDKERRLELMQRWNIAFEMIKKYGEKHPPIGVIIGK